MPMSRKPSSKAPSIIPKVQLPEDEKWKLIKQSQILKRLGPSSSELEPTRLDLPDEIFNSILLIIPFSFIYLMMDILIHTQYGKHPSVADFARRLSSAVPCLSILIFYVNRYRHRRLVTWGLFSASILVGTRLIWLVNRANWLTVIRQGPPLATLWILFIAILDLVPAIIGLGVVALWFWWNNMNLIF